MATFSQMTEKECIKESYPHSTTILHLGNIARPSQQHLTCCFLCSLDDNILLFKGNCCIRVKVFFVLYYCMCDVVTSLHVIVIKYKQSPFPRMLALYIAAPISIFCSPQTRHERDHRWG